MKRKKLRKFESIDELFLFTEVRVEGFDEGSFQKMTLLTDAPDILFESQDTLELVSNIPSYNSNGSFSALVNIGTGLGSIVINPASTNIVLTTYETVKTLFVNGTSFAASAAVKTTDVYGNNIYTWSSIASSFFTSLINLTPSQSILVEGSITFGGKKHDVLLDHREKITASGSITNTTQLLAAVNLTPNSTTQWIDHKGEILGTGNSATVQQAVVDYLYDGSAVKQHKENGTNVDNYVYVGQPYSFKYQMSEQVFQPQQGDTTELARFQLRSMNFNFNDTGTFVVTTASTGREAKTSTYTGRITGQAQNLLSYSAVVDSDSFKVGVQSQAKETDITITSDSHLPCVFQSAEYEGWVTLRNRRL